MTPKNGVFILIENQNTQRLLQIFLIKGINSYRSLLLRKGVKMSIISFKKIILHGLAIILLLLLLLIIWLVVFFVPFAIFSSKESSCEGKLFQLGNWTEGYYDSYHHYPVFTDTQGNPTFSWRMVLLQEYYEPKDIRLDESWQSEHNWPIIQRLTTHFDYQFACPFTYPKDNRAAFVTLIGEGTAWNEINAGRKTPKECKDMILILEIPNPKNHWAEPGDDVTPKEVIELFTAYKNRKKTFFPPKKHFPNRFYTAWNRLGSFDEIETVEELKRRLVIQNHRDADD